MLMIAIPNTSLDDLDGAGHSCRINGAPTVLRREGPYLVYVGADGTENRCKVLSEVRSHDRTEFMAASHGEDDAGNTVLALDEHGRPIDITGQRRVAVPEIRLATGNREAARRRRQMGKPDAEPTA